VSANRSDLNDANENGKGLWVIEVSSFSIELFDGLRAGLAANRAQFLRELPAGPFYGFNRPLARSRPTA
jgi:hypothetical protein